jgi:rhodanese-related sulfurtransferase
VIFVDSRSAFTGPKIQGAIQLSGAAAADWSKDQAKDALIVAYCTCPSEHTSMRLVLELQKQGFTNAFALKGGLTAWMNAGMPTESVAAAPAATP